MHFEVRVVVVEVLKAKDLRKVVVEALKAG